MTGAATLYPFYGNFSQQTIAGNIDLKGKFDTGPLKHSVLFGTDYFNLNQPLFGLGLDILSEVPTNIYNPVYHLITAPTMPGPSGINTYGINTEDWKGVYAQDMISTADDTAHLLIGGRYDWAQTGASFVGPSFYPYFGQPIYPSTAEAAFQTRNDQAFDPRVGLVYQPQPWLSFYGNFAQSFGTNLGESYNGSYGFPLAPSKATQWEGGAKAEFFDKRLSATLAFYDITKTNLETPDPSHPGYFIVIGAAESKGVEVDVTGRVNENWSLIANYSFDDARVTQGSPTTSSVPTSPYYEAALAGNRLASVPLNQGNLWVKYDADGNFTGLSVAGGLNVIGSSQGDNANSFQLPQYTLVNGMISYRFPWAGAKFTAQVNVKNIFNTTYYAASTDRYNILPGTPRAVLTSVRVEF